MKLLYCGKCRDVFRLYDEPRACRCGATSGRYIDEVHAVYSGADAVPLGFDNHSFTTALRLQERRTPDQRGAAFTAFAIPTQNPTFRKEEK